jgi:hypothetical protein
LCGGFQLLGVIKDWFVGQSLNFFLHLVWWQLLFGLEAVIITQVWLQHLREVLESRSLGYLLPYPNCLHGSSLHVLLFAFLSLILHLTGQNLSSGVSMFPK